MEVKEHELLDLRQTGDPFVDVGGLVINCLQEIYPNKSTYELIEYVTNIYVKQWGGKLHTYFLNSSITQPAFDTDRKISETLKFYKNEEILEYKKGISLSIDDGKQTFYTIGNK